MDYVPPPDEVALKPSSNGDKSVVRYLSRSGVDPVCISLALWTIHLVVNHKMAWRSPYGNRYRMSHRQEGADGLRADPMFKLAVTRAPNGGQDLRSQPIMNRLENPLSGTEVGARRSRRSTSSAAPSHSYRPMSSPMACPTRSAASSTSRSPRWAYLSVMRTLECPSRRETTGTGTPFITAWLACVWRRS